MVKRVVVQMSDECHIALKQYAAFYGMTMGEVLYAAARKSFHKQAKFCLFLQGVFKNLGITRDKRCNKQCCGFLCHMCTKETACTAGVYEGAVEVDQKFMRFITEEGRACINQMQEAYDQPCQTFVD